MEPSWRDEWMKMLKKIQQRKRWQRVTALLTAAVLLITAYSFILPASALESDRYSREVQAGTEASADVGKADAQAGEAEEDVSEEDGSAAPEAGSAAAADPAEKNTAENAGDGAPAPSENEASVGNAASAESEVSAASDASAGQDDVQTYSSPVEGEIINEGKLTDTLSWKYTEDDAGERTLTIYGAGAMPDYSSASGQPWLQYKSEVDNIVIEDGVTTVGAFAFSGLSPSRIEIGNDVTEIKKQAFASMRTNQVAVTIPGNVKTIGAEAFISSTMLYEVTLEEGVETIGAGAFDGTGFKELTIPASVTSIAAQFPEVSAYTVAEGNQTYYEEDGVLFRYLDGGEAELVSYPVRREGDTYTIPENVISIGEYAFAYTQSLYSVTVPSTVTDPLGKAVFKASNLEDIVIEDGVTFSTPYEMFAYCYKLRSVRFPENVVTYFDATFCQNTMQEEVTVPESITSLENNIFTNMKSLRRMTFNATDCKAIGTPFTSSSSELPQGFVLEIGSKVNILVGPESSRLGFSEIADRASEIVFKGENDRIEIEEGALDGAIKPLDGMSGAFYVDKQGILYKLDEEKQTASLVYCSPGNTEVTIPGSFTSGGEKYTVTSVGQYAFVCADGLKKITFEQPEKISEIAARAFSDCASLVEVNGETTVEKAEASFDGAEVGYQAFYGTGLTGAGGDGSYEENMDGAEELEIHYINEDGEQAADAMYVTVKSETAKWQPNADGTGGGYRLLTGDELNVEIAVGNTAAQDWHAYRVYFEMTGLDGYLGLEPGTEYDFNGIKATCHATEAPNIVYLDFQSRVGKTVTFSVPANYPSPGSEGGGLRIWGEAYYYTADEEQPEDLDPDEYIQAYWTTEPDDFTLAKASSGSSNVPLTGDGEGNTILSGNLGYTITLKRTGDEVSAYGKDYVRSVDYTDTPALPQGVTWKKEVLEAVEDGDVRISGNNIYAGDICVASLSGGSGPAVRSQRAVLSEDGQNIRFTWNVANTSGVSSGTEISANTINISLMAEALEVDLEQFTAAEEHIAGNTVEAVIHYHYAEDVTKEAHADKTLSAGNGSISLTKTGKDIDYFGEDVDYTLTVSNNGAMPYQGEGGYTLQDTLENTLYITPERMQEMFDGEYGNSLTVTVTGASLAQWNEVTGVDGAGKETSWQHPGNTDLDSASADHTLTIQKAGSGEDAIQVLVESGDTYTGETVYEALKAAGYAPTNSAVYSVSWELGDDTEFVMEAGEKRVYHVLATAKDTFLMLTKDWEGSYINETETTYINSAEVKDGDGGRAASASASNVKAVREAYLSKYVYEDGRKLTDSIDVENGDVLDYVLNFRHYGTGTYTDLPMVDDLYGSQMLLVEKEKNPQLEEKDLETYTDSGTGTEYYILSEGEYTDVVVGTESGEDYTAASVTVTRIDGESDIVVGDETYGSTGLHTQIKWYFPELKEAHSYQLSVTYKAIVDTSSSTDGTYDIGNVVWMNDRTGSRLYATLWGGGTIIDFDKEILLTGGDGEEEAARYSAISEGEEVRYRLTLRNKGNGEYVVKGSDLADILPNTYGVFEWTEENVKVEVEAGSKETQITGFDEGWYLSDKLPGSVSSKGQQYLLWDSDAQIRFHDASKVYIYVTLTFPANSEEEGGAALWDQYCAAVQGGTLTNTFTVYNFPANVTHNLRESGKVLLQKGVYGMGRMITGAYYDSGSRLYYNNRDMNERRAAYYIVLYNGDNARLYLNDIWDHLPEGYTYAGMVADASVLSEHKIYARADTIETSGASGFVDTEEFDGTEVTWKNARVDASAENGRLKFTVSAAGSGEDTLSYDEEKGMYYLARGEAVAFGYLCDIGLSEYTEDYAKNTAGMAYEDYLDAGITAVGKDEVMFTGTEDDGHTDFNDGECTVSTSDAAEEYGFDVDAEHEEWLMSDVTVSRGGIRPGVVKTTESYINSGGQEQAYETAVGPNDTVNWSVRFSNGGTLSMVDYTVRDILPSPYTLTGPVSYTICDGNGRQLSTRQLFAVKEHDPDDEKVTITKGTSTGQAELTVNGEEEEEIILDVVNDISVYLSLGRDDAGNEVITIRIPSRYMTIPEGGYAELTVSAENNTSTFRNGVYTNRAEIYPTQEFDGADQGSLIKDEEGTPEAVANTAPVNVANGYATKSVKQVTEIVNGELNPDNSASSDDPSGNTITLENAENLFRYTLSITNSTEASMSELVVIDSLPAEGDHSPFDPDALRGSEFQVDFADDPEIEVQVVTADGKEVTLPENQYSAEFSSKTEFDDKDWDGTNKEDWNEDSKNARSLRISIIDEEGVTIPANAEIRVLFNAQVHREDGEVTSEPGQTAWNSFGYHYGIMRVDYALEAMPLNVGVRVPTVPYVQKKLIGLDGEPYAVDKDTEFQIVIHEGDALDSYEEGAIAAAGRAITVVNLTVKAGESESEVSRMIGFNIWKWNRDSQKWIEQDDLWQWENGKTYTVIEDLPGRLPDGYEFDHFEGQSAGLRTHTFVYEPGVQETITCVNLYTRWRTELTKTDADDDAKLLAGAVFGLYSPKVADAMSEEDCAALKDIYGLDAVPDETLTTDEGTWYLMAAQKTGEDGKILWQDLEYEQYYLAELKAPDGYDLRTEPVLLERGSVIEGVLPVTVANDAGFELPKTGGPGSQWYAAGGLLLMAGALLCGYKKRRKGGALR